MYSIPRKIKVLIDSELLVLLRTSYRVKTFSLKINLSDNKLIRTVQNSDSGRHTLNPWITTLEISHRILSQ